MKDEALFLTVVKLWAATAWADGVLADKERRLLESVIRNAAVSPEAQTTALSFLERPIGIEEVPVEGLSAPERARVYRTACRMSTVDTYLHAEEQAFLDRLAARLQLDSAEATAIQAEYVRPPL